MAKVKMRGHMREVEIVTGMAARYVPRSNLVQMLTEEGAIRVVHPKWWQRAWRRIMRFFAAVWACIRGRPSASPVPSRDDDRRAFRERRRKWHRRNK